MERALECGFLCLLYNLPTTYFNRLLFMEIPISLLPFNVSNNYAMNTPMCVYTSVCYKYKIHIVYQARAWYLGRRVVKNRPIYNGRGKTYSDECIMISWVVARPTRVIILTAQNTFPKLWFGKAFCAEVNLELHSEG